MRLDGGPPGGCDHKPCSGLAGTFPPGNSRAKQDTSSTIADPEKALSAPNDRLIFIESVMDPFDAPAPVINSGNNGAEIDYGPRGPQHRGNMLIRPS
jgi:indolepyruvate decarboxylase